MVKWNDKTIWVTGISEGLGLTTTKSLLDLGYNVLGISRTYNGEFDDYTNFKYFLFDLQFVDFL